MSVHSDLAWEPPTTRQRRFAWVSSALLVDVVVLNLFVEYAESIQIDSFTVSVIAAVLIRVLIGATLTVEHMVAEFFRSRNRPRARLARFLGSWLVLFLSKFVILEVVDIVLGDAVELGGFVWVLVLSASMLIAEKLMIAVYQRL